MEWLENERLVYEILTDKQKFRSMVFKVCATISKNLSRGERDERIGARRMMREPICNEISQIFVIF